MMLLRRAISFARRLFSGEDVVQIRQSGEHWDQQFQKGAWDRLTQEQPNTVFIADYIIAEAQKREGLSVLDVGCGNGSLAKCIATTTNIRYCGLDISPTAIAAAQALHPRGEFIVADAATPPQSLGTFDIIVINEVIYYLNPTEAIRRYRNHAAPGALVIISIIRSWRSLVIWPRIRRVVRIATQRTLKDATHVWDVAIAAYI